MSEPWNADRFAPVAWTEPGRLPVELTEEQVSSQQAQVRGQLVGRLERLWEYADRHMDEDGRPDPRFAELGLRALDRIIKLYRLSEPAPEKGPEEVLPELSRERTRALILGQLQELESRARGE